MKKTIIILFVLAFCSELKAQIPKDVFPLSREFKKSGFFISPLATLSVGNKVEGNYKSSDSSYAYNYESTGRGKLGYGIEVGWFKSYDGFRFGDYLEAALSFRKFTGAAEHEGTLSTPNEEFYESENTFDIKTINASFRAADARQIGSNSFLTLALGINVNYIFSSEYIRELNYPSDYENFQDETSGQVHFQLGYGFKISKRFILTPTVETPIITVFPFDDLNPAFVFFDTNYHPIIIGLRVTLLRTNSDDCNAPTLPRG